MKLWDKYLVVRRDGTVPDWPYFVLAASDPAAPAAIRMYAGMAGKEGMDTDYVDDLFRLANSFEEWRTMNATGDPDAPQHRSDDLEVVSKIKAGSTPDGWKDFNRY